MKIILEFSSFEELQQFMAKGAAPIAPATLETPADTPKRTRKKAEKQETLPTDQTPAPVADATPAPEPTPVRPIMPEPTTPTAAEVFAAQPAAPAPSSPAAAAMAAPTADRATCAKAAANLMRAKPETRDQIRAVLDTYGVKAIPQIPEHLLPDFSVKLRNMGGTI